MTDFPSQSESLAEMLGELDISLADEQVALLDRYRQELWSWNKRMNLTRHTTLEKFVTRDVIDSWQLCQLVESGNRVLDMGTGGGVPGVVMAILRPDLTVAVSESTQKKAGAVDAIVGELQSPITVHTCRAEDVLEVSTFDAVVARAVAPLAKILRWLEPHWDAFDQLLLIKGRNWVAERGEARHLGLVNGLELRKAATYLTPRSDAESVILKVWQAEQEVAS